MYIKFPLEDLNLGPYPPHSTNTYTCEVTISLRVHNVIIVYLYFALIRLTCKNTIHTDDAKNQHLSSSS